jgi:ribosomal protein S18 acetylase RimI-like enzyme
MSTGAFTRVATEADAPALAGLVNSAYRGKSSRAGWTTEADLLGGQRVDVDRLNEIIGTPQNVILVHEQGGEPVACVHLEQTGDHCYLGMLTIRPTLQGTGLGRQILEAAEEFAVQYWGSRSMHMTVITQREELIAWYERRGYRRTGTRKPFPYGDERFGIPRRDDLVFDVLSKPLSAQRILG